MKDISGLMRQAQAMQARLQEAQGRMAETMVEGSAGGGAVRLTLKGSGELVAVQIDDEAITPGEGELLADLILAAHADAKRKLDEMNTALMKEAAGPMAGMMGGIPGMPKLF